MMYPHLSTAKLFEKVSQKSKNLIMTLNLINSGDSVFQNSPKNKVFLYIYILGIIQSLKVFESPSVQYLIK